MSKYLHWKRFQFGPKFIKWTQILYSNPQAAVKVNRFLSDRFALERGCRQGCSLSPLMFYLSIEPLAQLIRDDNNIKGLTINGEQQNISLYADDVLLYLVEPTITIPSLKDVINTFGYFSGYKVIIDKTMALDIGNTISQTVKAQSGLKWSKDGIKYLGIKILSSFEHIYDANYRPIIQNVSKELDRWSTLPLSMAGCIASIRMNILHTLCMFTVPEFLYVVKAL